MFSNLITVLQLVSIGAEYVPKQSNSTAHTVLCFPTSGGVSTHTCNTERVWSVIYLSPHNKKLPEFLNKLEKKIFSCTPTFIAVLFTIAKTWKQMFTDR